MYSPFKFLEPFTAADKDNYFGREQETEELFNMVSKASIALLYGLSGTGKTSLVQCGLGSRLGDNGWLPIFIRRKGNINHSLEEVLRDAAGKPVADTLTKAIRGLPGYGQRPVFLIFDQLEELFILGSWEEQMQLAANLRAVQDARLSCTILLVMREEFVGQLYPLEKELPALADNRMRLVPMNSARIKEAVLASFEQFNIRLESSAQTWLQEWTESQVPARASVSLPNLQVFLDRLYSKSFNKAFPGQQRDGTLPPLTISREDAGQFKEAAKALEKFFHDQELELQSQLSRRFPVLPRDTIRQALDIFVTEEGTIQPVPYQQEAHTGRLELPSLLQARLDKLSPASLAACFKLLAFSRLFRVSLDEMELAHDSLAALIDANRTDEQRQLNDIKRRIHNQFLDYQRSGELLKRRQLDIYEEYLPKLALDPTTQQFVQDSQAHAARQEALEKSRQQREIEQAQELAETQQRAVRRQRLLSILIGIAAIAAIAVGTWAWKERQQSRLEESQAKVDAFQTQLAAASSLRREGQYLQALEQLQNAATYAPEPKRQQALADSLLLYRRLFELMTLADSLARQDTTLTAALSLYQEAAELSSDRLIRQKAWNTRSEIDQKFENYIRRAENIIKYAGCQYAQDALYVAWRLKPEHQYLKKLLQQCPLKREERPEPATLQ